MGGQASTKVFKKSETTTQTDGYGTGHFRFPNIWDISEVVAIFGLPLGTTVNFTLPSVFRDLL